MSVLWIWLLIVALLAVLLLASYADRVYSEMGKFLAREYQDNVDSWAEKMEPKLKLGRESIAFSASVLRQLSLAAIAFLFGVLFVFSIARTAHYWPQLLTNAFALVLLILIFDRLVPQVLFARTEGSWVLRVRLLLQVLFYMVLPVTLLLQLMLSIAALAEPEEKQEQDHPDEAMDALLEAGEEEGILEESDRELVRSVVEFGDKVVREVMTPRPEIFAIPESMTLRDFTAEIEEHVFSRVPVYRESLDNVTGIAFAHDLLRVTDADAVTRTIAQIQRPAAFVPETKMVAELLREMQSEKQHMRIVIDEYGGVAGIVTIEDLLEAIVGNIADEHDEGEEHDEPVRDEDGAFVVSGSFELTRLRDLFAEQFAAGHRVGNEDNDSESDTTPPDEDGVTGLRLPGSYESTTVGGLVSEIAGHIPLPGEVVEEEGLRMEVLASTDRRIDRVRVSLTED